MHLFLVGPPGIGKSTLAPALARHFGAAVIELDREIERRAGKSCKDVIERDGMDRFRELESSALMRLQATPAWTIVDTGGGAPIRDTNRKRMRQLGLLVGLRGPVDRLAAGLAAPTTHRPQQEVPPRGRARAVLPQRRPRQADGDVHYHAGR